MARLPLLLTFLFLNACATAPISNAPVAASERGSIEKYGSKLSVCGLTASGICEARIYTVDSKSVSMFANTVSVEAGVRSILVGCRQGRAGAPGGIETAFTQFFADISPGGKYRIRARIGGDRCLTTIEDIVTGVQFEGTEVQ